MNLSVGLVIADDVTAAFAAGATTKNVRIIDVSTSARCRFGFEITLRDLSVSFGTLRAQVHGERIAGRLA
jgi:hypothetical protein